MSRGSNEFQLQVAFSQERALIWLCWCVRRVSVLCLLFPWHCQELSAFKAAIKLAKKLKYF